MAQPSALAVNEFSVHTFIVVHLYGIEPNPEYMAMVRMAISGSARINAFGDQKRVAVLLLGGATNPDDSDSTETQAAEDWLKANGCDLSKVVYYQAHTMTGIEHICFVQEFLSQRRRWIEENGLTVFVYYDRQRWAIRRLYRAVFAQLGARDINYMGQYLYCDQKPPPLWYLPSLQIANLMMLAAMHALWIDTIKKDFIQWSRKKGKDLPLVGPLIARLVA